MPSYFFALVKLTKKLRESQVKRRVRNYNRKL